ncbi:MAG: Rieske (2Fe-2S) protein, partial [Acidimicrobiales bacterium]
CHWHHARFDLCSGATLDPFADDAVSYDVAIDEGRVLVSASSPPFDLDVTLRRVEEGLEHGLTLVLAKAVLAMEAEGVEPEAVIGAGVRFGCRFRATGFGPGLTVLCAMANVLEHLDEPDRALALVHGLTFVSGDTRDRAPWFPLDPLGGASAPPDRLAAWYRRFVETRSADAAERVLSTAIASGMGTRELAEMTGAAATDHVFLDEGHVVDFTNKAFELVDRLSAEDPSAASLVLPTLVHQTVRATRQEEEGPWRHPHDLALLVSEAVERLDELVATTRWQPVGGDDARHFEADGGTGVLGWQLLDEDPVAVVGAIFDAVGRGASAEQLGRAVAYASALRITRFHVQNDHGDWNVVHHGFTSASALHQLLVRAPSPLLVRGVFHAASKVFLDRFLNVPAARLPSAHQLAASAPLRAVGAASAATSLDGLRECWDGEGHVDDAGAIVYVYLHDGGSRHDVVAALGHALLVEDAGFHWFQLYEAAVRQAFAWPEGAEEGALILAGAARFLAAHTPTRRELAQVVRIARRLRRGEALYADDDADADAGAERVTTRA